MNPNEIKTQLQNLSQAILKIADTLEEPKIPRPPATTFDFGDGAGPVPAHKHPNGGGWVADSASIHPSAFVAATAKVYGKARLYRGSQVFDHARVFGDAQVFEFAYVPIHIAVHGDARISITT